MRLNKKLGKHGWLCNGLKYPINMKMNFAKTICYALVAVAMLLSGCAKNVTSKKPTPIKKDALEEGYASWYGPGFHGKRTASGERFNMNALTCAHKTLPFGTHLKVVNLATEQSVVVKVNDRGPFIAGRVIDLSKGAARAVGIFGSGTGKVRLDIVADASRFADVKSDVHMSINSTFARLTAKLGGLLGSPVLISDNHENCIFCQSRTGHPVFQ